MPDDVLVASRLSSSDYEAVLRVIAVLGEIRDPDEFAQVVPAVLPSVVASDATSLNDVDPRAGQMRAVVKPDSFPVPRQSALALQELAGQHPLISHMSSTGDGSPIKISDFWDVGTWHASDVYARVYAPMGIEHQMALALPAPRPAVVGLALNRVDARTDFTEHDRGLLDRLRPHLAQGWRNARDHDHVRRLLASAGRALASRAHGVLLLDEPVYELTDGAFTELYRYLGRPPADGSLPLRVQRWLERERRRSPSTAPPALRPLVAHRAGRRLAIRLVPGTGGDPDALLLTVTEESDVPAHLERLGLSPREAQVLGLVTTGATNISIASALFLAPATVRHHLENIYRKLGVNGRVQASALALSLQAPATEHALLDD